MIKEGVKAIIRTDKYGYTHLYNVATQEHAEEALKRAKEIYPEARICEITDIIKHTGSLQETILELAELLGHDGRTMGNSGQVTVVHIDGDWKHDHGHFDYIVETVLGVKCFKETVTEPSDSDWYKANHYYFTPISVEQNL